MLKKVYFPRLLMPLAAVLAGFVDFLIAFIVLLAMMAYYQITPGAAIISVPFFIVLATATAIGVGLWFSALNVYYRDVRYVVPFLIQFWLFATPIAYPISIVPEQWRTLYGLNPMVGVVEGFRWALLGAPQPPALMLAVSGVAVILLVIGGLFYFRRMEQTFADEA
jgi:lipopolysaccharide transport system permease protein